MRQTSQTHSTTHDAGTGSPFADESVMSHAELIIREIPPRAPDDVALALADRRALVWLDSAKDHDGLGRYSIVAADPFGMFRIDQGNASFNGEMLDGAPLDTLRRQFKKFPVAHSDAVPFATGAIGFFAYEFGHRLEYVPNAPASDTTMPDAVFGFYDCAFVHDHRDNRSFLVSSGYPEEDPASRRGRAEARIAEFQLAFAAPRASLAPSPVIQDWVSNFTRASYENAVQTIIERILNGDVFQANLSQRFEAEWQRDASPLAFYRHLRNLSPAPFGSYLDFGDVVVASNSPERFLSLRNGVMEARPIKGTAPRGRNPIEDKALADALIASVKDRAENTMIVDLLRNDLSRVAKAGTVNVPVLCGLETYASVHHLVSVVTAHLAEGRDVADVIAATFPGGSITGAPKIKAMEVIGSLEGVPRGVYCGAIGAIGFDGEADLNIAIRTVTIRDHKVRFHVGGGITALSNPHAEYDETLAKAERIFKSFGTNAERFA